MTAQAVTIDDTGDSSFVDMKGIQKIKWTWTCTDAGVVAASTTAGEIPTTTFTHSGELIRLITKPGTAGDAPTDNYDVTILDSDGYDVLMGAGADRDTANTEQVLKTSLGICQNTTLSLRIAAAGNAKKGTVIIYIK
jgi:hypothetical protein